MSEILKENTSQIVLTIAFMFVNLVFFLISSKINHGREKRMEIELKELQKNIDTGVGIKLENIKSDLNQKNNLASELSIDKKKILSIMNRMNSKYYSDLGNLEVFKKIERAFDDLSISYSQDVEISYDVGCEYTLHLLGVFNELVLNNTQSKKIYDLFLFYTKYAYNQDEYDFKNKNYVSLCYNSLLYKEVVMDFKGVSISDTYLIQINVTDYDKMKEGILKTIQEIKKYAHGYEGDGEAYDV